MEMKPFRRIGVLFLALASLLPAMISAQTPPPPSATQTAVFGMGCFWCSQALFEKFRGVRKVVCGYAGGTTANPTYEEVSSGTTGHAEVVQITFDPAQITYQQLLDIFWDIHDPTTLNQQGADEGTQYRSLILTANPEQQRLAEAAKKAAAAKFKGAAITTEIAPLKAFYVAEDYHQDYFKKHPHAPYCVFVISPKLEKLKAHHTDLKPEGA